MTEKIGLIYNNIINLYIYGQNMIYYVYIYQTKLICDYERTLLYIIRLKRFI